MGVDYPRNALTDLIEQNAANNRAGVRQTGVASATPPPTVQSADYGQVVDDGPLSPEQIAELDLLAVQAGVQDERLGTGGDPSVGSEYKTMDEAIAAGEAVSGPALGTDLVPQYAARALVSRQNAREFIGKVGPPRLPDFSRVMGIDLLRGCVIVDGMDYPITPSETKQFQRYAVGVARTAILAKLAEAASIFEETEESTPAKAEATSEPTGPAEEPTAVQREPEGSGEEPQV